MKAYVLHGVGDLRYEDVPLPELLPGWALIKVLAAGICSSDIPRIFEKGTYRFPTIPGHEFCGVVEAVHDTENEGWVGKRVGVYPLIPCKKCPACLKGQYETCGDYDYIGSRRDGAFAEYVAAPVWNLIELPERISDLEGALLEPAAVALHAVRKLGGLPGKSVCVLGTGAIGFLACQWAKILGAERVVIKGRGAGKEEFAERCGLEYLTQAVGEFDCVVEAVGSPEAITESILLAKPGGRLVLLGNPSGDIALGQDVYWRILRRQLTVVGTWNSSFSIKDNDWAETLRAVDEGRLNVKNVVSHVFVQSDLMRGLTVIKDKSEVCCKAVVRREEFACT